MKELKLNSKVAVVIGGNSGIGLATAKLFSAEGAKVAISGRNPLTIQSALAEIGNAGFGLVSDISNLNDISELYLQVNKRFGKIDVLVVNAGVYITAPLADYSEAWFDQTSDINFKGAFFSVQKALPFLNDGASVILTGSTVAGKARVNGAAFAATKAAIRSLARSFSSALLDRNIRVNVVSPGPTDTPVFERNGATKEQVQGVKNYLKGITPAGRLADTSEIAEAFLYMASDDSKYIVGTELLIDGGFRTL